MIKQYLPLIGLLFVPLFVLFIERLFLKRLKFYWDIFKFIPALWSLLFVLYILSEEVKLPASLRLIKDKALWVVFILSLSLLTSRLVALLLRMYMNRYRQEMPAVSLVVQASKVLVLLVGVIIALDKIGIAITPILTALGVGGLAVALALRDTLENLFAGFHVLASGHIKVGNYIRLEGGEEGFVEDITWRNTVIRQPSDNLIIVPNSKLSSSIVINFHKPDSELAVIVPVGVSYDSDLEKVEKITIEVAKEVQREVEGAVPDFEPFIRYTAFGDFSINFNVILRAKDVPSQHILRHEFIKRLKRRYEEEDIKIPFPIREVYLRSLSKE